MRDIRIGAGFDAADGVLQIWARLPNETGMWRVFCDNAFLGRFPAAELSAGLTLTPIHLHSQPMLVRMEAANGGMSCIGRVWHRSDAFRAFQADTIQAPPSAGRLLVLLSGARAPAAALLGWFERHARLHGCDGLLELRFASPEGSAVSPPVFAPWALRARIVLPQAAADPVSLADTINTILGRLPAALCLPLDVQAEALIPHLRSVPLLLRRPVAHLPESCVALVLPRGAHRSQDPVLHSTGRCLDMGGMGRSDPYSPACASLGRLWLGLPNAMPQGSSRMPTQPPAAMFMELLERADPSIPRILLHDGGPVAARLASLIGPECKIASLRGRAAGSQMQLNSADWRGKIVIYPGTDPEIDRLMVRQARLERADYLSAYSRSLPAETARPQKESA